MRISGTMTIIAAAGAILASAACTPSQEDFTKYVDPTIGTGGHGHVFYGASVPYGLVQLGPTSIPQDWDWTSGYHISDSTVIGFPHTHAAGRMTLAPAYGPIRTALRKRPVLDTTPPV